MTGVLNEDLCTFMTVSRSLLLIMRNVSYKSYRENQETHFVFSNCFTKIVQFMRMWKIWYSQTDHRWQYNAGQKRCDLYVGWQGKIQTHTQRCLILIAFPRRQWLGERVSVLRYTFIICRVFEIAAAAVICNRIMRIYRKLMENLTTLNI